MKIALIAGETSGDQLGGWLMEALARRFPDATFIGLGGPNMQAQGLRSLFPMQDIALMGFAEILPHLRRLKRRMAEIVAYLEAERPDLLITIDSGGFNFRVVKALRKNARLFPSPAAASLTRSDGLPLPLAGEGGVEGVRAPKRTVLLHYVAPTVWAYKPQRAKKIAALYDRLFCLLPFEPPYFEKEGLASDFIGHEIAWWWREKGDGLAFRTAHAIAPDAPILAIFPGSRSGELKRLLPVFGQTMARLAAHVPHLHGVVQVPAHQLEAARTAVASWPLPCTVISNTAHKKDLFAAATVALTKSGTIALECALAGLPNVTTYCANPLTAWLVRRMLRTPFVNLANILAGRMLVPELLQEDCAPTPLTEALLPLLTHPEALATQRDGFAEIAAMLGAEEAESPSAKAAGIVVELLR